MEDKTINKTTRKQLHGEVISRSGDKTAVVKVTRKKMHPVYKKAYAVSKRYHAHDPQNKSSVGDSVVIEEMRPVSKLKRWRIV